MRKHSHTYKFKEVIKSLKEQGTMDNGTYIVLCKELKVLDHGIVVRDHKQVAKAVEKISKVLWEVTR